MNNLALQDARQHVLFQHGDADGYITMAQKDPETDKFRQYHYKQEELADHLSEWIGPNTFFSQNTFYRPQRSIENIRQLRSLYVDLDVYNIGFEPEYILQKLELEVFGDTLPDPNMVIFSGRGLVLIWHIEPIPYKVMSLWRAVEMHFISVLKEMGADSKASDPTRIFRVAGTINAKNGAMVKVEYRHDYKYDIHQLRDDYLPELEPSKLKAKKKGRKNNVVHMFNIYSLHIARAKDITKLVEMRNGHVGKHREYICFLYRYFTCCIAEDTEDALEATMNLNNKFRYPLSKREVEISTKSAEKAWKARSCKEANKVAVSMGYPGAGYNIKNDKLILWLGITPEEEMKLSTIISKRENRRREKIERHKNGMLPREEYLKQQQDETEKKLAMIKKELKENPKASIRTLAEKTGLSKSAVQRLKAKI